MLMREEALMVLAEAGQAAMLRSFLRDPQQRIAAAVLLHQLHPKDGDGLTALMDDLRGINPAMRRQAADALGEIGPTARSAVAALRQALHDPAADVRLRAAEAIHKIDGPVQPKDKR